VLPFSTATTMFPFQLPSIYMAPGCPAKRLACYDLGDFACALPSPGNAVCQTSVCSHSAPPGLAPTLPPQSGIPDHATVFVFIWQVDRMNKFDRSICL
jgi:hypothetical protein